MENSAGGFRIFRQNSSSAPCLAVVFVLLALLFLPTLYLRSATFGKLPIDSTGGDGTWRSLTSISVIMGTNWSLRSPLHSGFLLQQNVDSVEFGPWWHVQYVSYPPGFLLPVHAATLLTGSPPTVASLMVWSLAWHFLLACIMAMLAFSIADKWDRTSAFSLAILVGAMILYLPASLEFFQNVWWPDLAGLIPFAAVVALELSGKFRGLQLVLLGFGLLTDWLNFLLAGLLLAKWASRKQYRACFMLAGVLAIFCCFYFWFVTRNDSALNMFTRFRERTGLSPAPGAEWSQLWKIFWADSMVRLYGASGLGLIGGLLFFLFLPPRSEEQKSVRQATFLILIPMLFHSFLLHQHYVNHVYNTLKFVIPISLLPLVLWALFSGAGLGKRTAPFLAGTAAVVYVAWIFPNFLQSRERYTSLSAAAMGKGLFVRKNTKQTDLLFSTDSTIMELGDGKMPDLESYQLAAVSFKYIYLAQDISGVRNMIQARRATMGALTDPAAYEVKIFGKLENEGIHRYWKKFAKPGEIVSGDGKFYLLSLDKSSLFPAQRVPSDTYFSTHSTTK